MICASIANTSYENCLAILEKEDFVEIRIDKLDFTDSQFETIFRHPTNTLATCRIEGMSEETRLNNLRNAINWGADIIDIEIEAEEQYRKKIVNYAKEKGKKVIVSYHNFIDTPSESELNSIMLTCYKLGADIAKIITTVNNNTDRLKVLSLYKDTSHKLIAFGMGEQGKLTRALSVVLGAPYTYAAPDGMMAVAPGQISASELRAQINFIKKI
jgi:3-dehydroquinate dehydratase type I